MKTVLFLLSKIRRRKNKKSKIFMFARHASLIRILSFFRKRRPWRHPELCPNMDRPGIGSVKGHYETVVPLMSDERFQKYFRISRGTLQYLCEKLSPVLNKKESNFRQTICTGKRILISIHVLKSTCDTQSIASIYKVGKSTVAYIVKEFCENIVSTLYKNIIN